MQRFARTLTAECLLCAAGDRSSENGQPAT